MLMRLKKPLAAFALLGATALVTAPASVLAAPAVGKPAPEFTAIDSNGKTVKLSDQKGSIVVLEWTNHECPFVVKHYDSSNMQSLQNEAQGQKVVWWSVISSAPGKQGHVTAAQANELTSERGALPSAVLLDPEGKLGRLYGARTTPHMYVIDPQGNLAYMGAIDDKPSTNKADAKTANNYVRTALAALENGKAVNPAQTPPYGCSVKY